MREIVVDVRGIDLDFEKAKAIADVLVGGTLISWSDGRRSYPEVSCGDKPGWISYGETRGNVKVKINNFTFYYLSDEEAEH